MVFRQKVPQPPKPPKPKSRDFSNTPGNHDKRCALMHWSCFLLNDDIRCLVWGADYRSTEAKRDIKKQRILVNQSGKKFFKKIKRSTLIDNIFKYQNDDIVKKITNKNKKTKESFMNLFETEKIIFAAKKSNKLKKFIKIV